MVFSENLGVGSGTVPEEVLEALRYDEFQGPEFLVELEWAVQGCLFSGRDPFPTSISA